MAVTEEQFDEVREAFEGATHWFPYEVDPHFDSAKAVIFEARRLLAETTADDSAERRDLEEAIEKADQLMREGDDGWVALRNDILRNAGCVL